MPFERRDVAERTIFPKHLLTSPRSLFISGRLGIGQRVWAVRVCVEDYPLAGLRVVDSVALSDGDLVLVRILDNTRRAGIYRAREQSWDLVHELTDGEIVFVQEGAKHSGTLNVAKGGYTIQHDTAIVRGASTVNFPVGEWVMLGGPEIVVPSPFLESANPMIFRLPSPGDLRHEIVKGLWHVDVHVRIITPGIPTTVGYELAIFRDAAEYILTDYGIEQMWERNVLYLHASIVMPMDSGQEITVRANATQNVTRDVRFYCSVTRVL